MFCTKCGQEVPENVKFCPACGHEVKTSVPPPVKTPVVQCEEEPQTVNVQPVVTGLTLSQLNIKDLKKLNVISLGLVQLGYFIFLQLLLLLPVLRTATRPHVNILSKEASAILCYGMIIYLISHWYIYTFCRTKLARVFLYVESIAFMIYFGIGTIVSGIDILYLVYFLVAVYLFVAASTKDLWGDNGWSRAQIKTAYKLKQQGEFFTDEQLPPKKGYNDILNVGMAVFAFLTIFIPVWFLEVLMAIWRLSSER